MMMTATGWSNPVIPHRLNLNTTQKSQAAHATPHALRHTGITEGVHAPDANVVDISQIAGHKDLRTTMGYVHTSTQRLHDAVAKLPNVGNS